MKYKIIFSSRFKKAYKRCMKRGLNQDAFKEVYRLLERDGFLPEKYHPHMLHGDMKGIWECHIEPDWLLLWKQNENELVLILTDTGTHSDLFKK